MVRAGMQVGEVLKIRPVDVQDRKITLPDPKSGKESEVVFIPQINADRLKDYISEKGIEPDQRVFPITNNAARVMVKKAGSRTSNLSLTYRPWLMLLNASFDFLSIHGFPWYDLYKSGRGSTQLTEGFMVINK